MTNRRIALALCAAAFTQVAWTGYATKSGVPIRWYEPTVDVKADDALCADVPAEDALAAIRESFGTWNAVACMQPKMQDAGTVHGVPPFAGKSPSQRGNDLVIFEDADAWAATADPAKGAGVIALTTLFYDPTTGQARSYALEVNDGAFTFATGVQAGKMDLANTLTHEFGHVLGLDHSDVRNATMFYSASFGDVAKRTLADDDTTGICTLYATQYAEVDLSEHGGGGDCATGTTPHPAGPLALLAGLAVFALARRRRR
jgi:MYXO-CTERM domain-containing protein